MTAEPGQTKEVRVRDAHLSHFHVTAYEIVGKDEFHPQQEDQGWDATENKLALVVSAV